MNDECVRCHTHTDYVCDVLVTCKRSISLGDFQLDKRGKKHKEETLDKMDGLCKDCAQVFGKMMRMFRDGRIG